MLIKVTKTIFNTDVFRCIFLLLVTTRLVNGVFPVDVMPYVNYIILPWGYSLLLWNIIIKRTVFQLKHIWILVAFLALYALSLWWNDTYFQYNIDIFRYIILSLLVLCPPEKTVSLQSKYQFIFTFCAIFVVPVTVVSAMSVWSYIDSAELYTATYRLQGYFSTPNRAGHSAFMCISLIVIMWTLLKKLFSRGYIVSICKICLGIAILIHMTMLTLSDSRAGLVSLLFFVLVFSFFAFLRLFFRKGLTIVISTFSAILAAIIIMGMTYASSTPIRIGATMFQAMVAGEIRTETSAILPTSLMVTAGGHNLVIFNESETDEDDKPTLEIMQGRNISLFTDTGRLPLWQIAFEVVRKHPFVGVSPAGLQDAVIEAYYEHPETDRGGYSEGLLSAYFSIGNLNGAHNVYIQLAATTGIPALVVFLLFFIMFAIYGTKILFKNIKSDNYIPISVLLALCAGILMYSMFGNVLLRPIYHFEVLLWSSLSFAASLLQYEGDAGGC